MIDGSFRRTAKDSYYLFLKITNNSPQNLSEFMLKVNNNYYGVQAEEPIH